MDFSLLQTRARYRLLRDITALKQVWVYYMIGVIDPILRFSWIFYAIFTHNTQHSTIVSFAIALGEVARRGMWTLLRVENEHCSNVAQYKASRDTPLPYHIDMSPVHTGEETPGVTEAADGSPSSAAISMGTTRTQGQGSVRISTGTDNAASFTEGGQPEEGRPSFRRRRADTVGKRSIRQVMAEAHKQDFEKKRPVGDVASEPLDEEDDDRSEEDEDDEQTGSASEERMQLREAEYLVKDGHDRSG